MQATVTRCGWARWSAPGVDGAARFTSASSGRLVVAEVVAVGEVRTLPVMRLEAWANGPGRDALTADLLGRSLTAGAELDRLDGIERAEAPRRAAWGATATAEAEQQAMLALCEPDERDDDFYTEVARVYGEATVRTGRPAAAIAAASGVNVRTVYEWVRGARRRGLIAPARRGVA